MPPPARNTLQRIRVGLAGVVLLGLVACGTATSPAPDSPTVMPNQVPVGFGTATLTWTPVTTDTGGTPLADLAGYRIYYGSSPADLATMIPVPDPSATTYLVGGLPSGTWYFAVTAYTSEGAESARSNVGSKTIS